VTTTESIDDPGLSVSGRNSEKHCPGQRLCRVNGSRINDWSALATLVWSTGQCSWHDMGDADSQVPPQTC
jgi:hypothetical protein